MTTPATYKPTAYEQTIDKRERHFARRRAEKRDRLRWANLRFAREAEMHRVERIYARAALAPED